MAHAAFDADAQGTTAATLGGPRGRAGVFARHLTSLAFPAVSLLFVWTGPHAWFVAPLFLAPSVAFFLLDGGRWVERRQPEEGGASWPFDALVVVLAALQLLIVFELCRMYQHQALFSVDTVMTLLVVGGSSGFSIVTAHELIHRSRLWEQLLGRLLLCTVLYEHFFTEHLRGHHLRVGTSEDPATARFGEDYESFFRRTVPAQFRSAWRLEARRLGDEDMSLLDPRMLRNRILHGIALGWGMAFAAWAAFGFAAFAVFLAQAFMAVRLLEAVNYFEHWGLRRRKARVRPVDSWDTHSWFTYYGLIGLSRHADHHAWPRRPFEKLRVWEEAPVLPAGYVGSVDMVMARNEEFRHRATLELALRQLGPFDPEAEVEPELRSEAAAALERARAFEAEREAGPPPAQPVRWRRVALFLLGAAAFVTLGAAVEAADSRLLAAFGLNLWILIVFAAGFALRARIERAGAMVLSWAFFFGWLLALGQLTERALA